MLNLGPWFERRDVQRGVLVNLHDAVAVGTHDVEKAVGPVLFGENSLLDLRLEGGRVRQYPDLDETHRLVLRGGLLRGQGAGAEGQALHRARRQRPVRTAGGGLVAKGSFPGTRG